MIDIVYGIIIGALIFVLTFAIVKLLIGSQK